MNPPPPPPNDRSPPPDGPARGPFFPRLGRFAYRRRRSVLAASAVLLALSVLGVLSPGPLVNILSTSTEAGRALALVRKELPETAGESFDVVFSSATLPTSDPQFQAAVEACLAPLRGDRRVTGVRTPYDLPEPVRQTVISRDGRRLLVTVSLGADPIAAAQAFDDLRPRLRSETLQLVVTGQVAIDDDFDLLLFEDITRVEAIALPLALIVLLLVFRTVVAALLPLGVATLAVLGGLAGVFGLSHLTNVSQYALNIVSMIGLGVAIDYSLFIVARFREELAAGAGVEAAVVAAVSTAGRAVFYSGVAVVVGMGGLLFFRGLYLDTIGVAGSLVVALAVLYSVTVLPALLGVLGPRINAGRLPLPAALSAPAPWRRLALAVMRRPVLVLLPTLAVLAAAAAPFARVHLAASDVNTLPRGAESRVGRELVLREFDQDPTPALVVVRFPDGRPLAPPRIKALYDLGQRITALPHVTRLQSVVNLPGLGRDGHVRLLTLPRLLMPAALRDGIAQSVGATVLLLAVSVAPDASAAERAAVVHAIRGLRPIDGGELLVTGLTASDIDYSNYVRDRVPAAVGFVVVTTTVILFLLLGSVLLPLKAVLLNLLSLTASFGALVWIFQDGHLAGILSFAPGPIEPVLPIVLFCLVFGLSMDYEVFLLTRMQEEWIRTGDNQQAVAGGLERSGRLITSAAGIMVLVFAAFAFAEVVPIKAIGLSMALAVALDATIVRMLLVPATMRLLGHRNWWAPAPLARLYRRLGLGEVRDDQR